MPDWSCAVDCTSACRVTARGDQADPLRVILFPDTPTICVDEPLLLEPPLLLLEPLLPLEPLLLLAPLLPLELVPGPPSPPPQP